MIVPASADDKLGRELRRGWSAAPGEKVAHYIGQFFDTTRLGDQISGRLEGNHGTYTVTIKLDGQSVTSACSCYIGKHGGCHHVAALAHTFLDNPSRFTLLESREVDTVQALPDLATYLRSHTLADLLVDMRGRGITQKAFYEAVGMSSQHLSAVRSAEQRNHFYHELGAIKLAVLWVMEHIAEAEK